VIKTDIQFYRLIERNNKNTVTETQIDKRKRGKEIKRAIQFYRLTERNNKNADILDTTR
jgi:hypothetical protein